MQRFPTRSVIMTSILTSVCTGWVVILRFTTFWKGMTSTLLTFCHNVCMFLRNLNKKTQCWTDWHLLSGCVQYCVMQCFTSHTYCFTLLVRWLKEGYFMFGSLRRKTNSVFHFQLVDNFHLPSELFCAVQECQQMFLGLKLDVIHSICLL